MPCRQYSPMNYVGVFSVSPWNCPFLLASIFQALYSDRVARSKITHPIPSKCGPFPHFGIDVPNGYEENIVHDWWTSFVFFFCPFKGSNEHCCNPPSGGSRILPSFSPLPISSLFPRSHFVFLSNCVNFKSSRSNGLEEFLVQIGKLVFYVL